MRLQCITEKFRCLKKKTVYVNTCSKGSCYNEVTVHNIKIQMLEKKQFMRGKFYNLYTTKKYFNHSL